jgi:hypothetical protein
MAKYTERELDELIDGKVNSCNGLPNVCKMLGNEVGKSRIKARVKELILEGGIHDVDAALAQIESQLFFEIE